MLDVQLATDTFSQQARCPCRLPRCRRQSVSFVNLAFFLCLAFLRRAISFALDTVTTAVDCFCRCRPVHPAVLARATPLTASVLRLAFVVAEHPWP